MRDPSRMIKGMQQRRSVVPVFGDVSDKDKDEVCSYLKFYLGIFKFNINSNGFSYICSLITLLCDGHSKVNFYYWNLHSMISWWDLLSMMMMMMTFDDLKYLSTPNHLWINIYFLVLVRQ
ncbi:hypothetical protein HanPI659440_Chr17g0690981 [Helianthus annuus]|nr:hypothetical protein HanPI659440_Chr17g0690981 [Helianthus annuus]